MCVVHDDALCAIGVMWCGVVWYGVVWCVTAVVCCVGRCWTQGVDCLPCPDTYWKINNVSADWCVKEEGDLSGEHCRQGGGRRAVMQRNCGAHAML